MSDDRPIARVENGVVIIRASALGMCVRALWASLEGIEAAQSPEWLTDAAERGNRYEKAMGKKLAAEGYVFLSFQEEVEYWVIPGKLKILGHTDGIVSLPPEAGGTTRRGRLLEVKSMSPRVFKAWMADGFLSKPHNAWQLGVYMAATKLPAHYICVRAHEEANDLGQLAIDKHVMADDTAIDIRDIVVPPRTETEIKAKAMAVYKAWKVGEMPACEEVFPCPFYFLHDEDEFPETNLEIVRNADPYPLALDPKVEEERRNLATIYHAKKRQEATLKKEIEVVRDQLLAIGPYETDKHTIEITEKRGRLAFDKDRLAADHPEIDMTKYESRGKVTRALSVKER